MKWLRVANINKIVHALLLFTPFLAPNPTSTLFPENWLHKHVMNISYGKMGKRQHTMHWSHAISRIVRKWRLREAKKRTIFQQHMFGLMQLIGTVFVDTVQCLLNMLQEFLNWNRQCWDLWKIYCSYELRNDLISFRLLSSLMCSAVHSFSFLCLMSHSCMR